MLRIIALLTVVALTTAASGSASQVYSSGKQQVSLLELYTSEGCSSCPPADRWLTNLKDHAGLFETFIPIAFHVDYWNYLGWRDEFSDPSYSARQRNYKHTGLIESVYTPGFVINGEEWRGFFHPLGRNQPPLEQERLVGDLRLEGKSDEFLVQFNPENAAFKNLKVHLVYLGTDLTNKIRRGENAGKKLEHDFVVLAHVEAELDDAGKAVLPRGKVKHATAVAAWVSERSNPAPIQAVGGWLAVH